MALLDEARWQQGLSRAAADEVDCRAARRGCPPDVAIGTAESRWRDRAVRLGARRIPERAPELATRPDQPGRRAHRRQERGQRVDRAGRLAHAPEEAAGSPEAVAGHRGRHRAGHRRRGAQHDLRRDRRPVLHHARPAQDFRRVLPGTEHARVPAADLQEMRGDDVAVLAAERPAARLSFSPVLLAALAVGLVPFALHVWAVLHGGLDQDDFVITYRAAQAGPFDPGYLFQDYHGHLAPGGFLLAWLLTAWAPLNPAVMATPLLLMQAVVLVLFWQVLVRCFGRRWAILVPFTVFAASPLVQVPTLWWSFGMQFVPVLFAAAAALHAHVRYLQEAGRWPIGSLGGAV